VIRERGWQPQSCNAGPQFAPESKRDGHDRKQQGIAEEREEIAARVANFRATQEKFEREREEYFVSTLENARHSSERPPWS
jgi:hypothetical protein